MGDPTCYWSIFWFSFAIYRYTVVLHLKADAFYIPKTPRKQSQRYYIGSKGIGHSIGTHEVHIYSGVITYNFLGKQLFAHVSAACLYSLGVLEPNHNITTQTSLLVASHSAATAFPRQPRSSPKPQPGPPRDRRRGCQASRRRCGLQQVSIAGQESGQIQHIPFNPGSNAA